MFYLNSVPMTKLRRNHNAQGKGLQTTFRMVILLIIAILALVGGFIYLSNANLAEESQEVIGKPELPITYLPTSNGEIVKHKHYTLSYIEKAEQAEWTAYILTRSSLKIPNVPRYDYFSPDPNVSTLSANHNDYSNSGYSRGHLVPAGDMAFDTLAMRETFYMSNISPQIRGFNGGIWRELEENVRDWAFSNDSLYVITGPIFAQTDLKSIGKSSVAVSSRFYKVILDYSGLEKKGIAFIIPNEVSDRRLEDFIVPIDSVEQVTKLDFFNDMINDQLEEQLESYVNPKLWKISEKRYQLRVNTWNKEN